MDNSDKDKKSFIQYVFNFDEDSKSELLNISQYSILAIVPIVLLNKAMQRFVPELDDTKGSLEILAEIVLQVIVMFLGLFFVDRLVTFVPTYSGINYPVSSITFIVLSVLMITLSLQTKIGEKVNILVDRIYLLWEGKKEQRKEPQQQQQQQMVQYSDSTPISQLPPSTIGQQQQLPNYNNMYKDTSTPLVNAESPNYTEPMAANDLLSSGAFGNW
jgi:hypothetical protein